MDKMNHIAMLLIYMLFRGTAEDSTDGWSAIFSVINKIVGDRTRERRASAVVGGGRLQR